MHILYISSIYDRHIQPLPPRIDPAKGITRLFDTQTESS